jgi:leucyl-tRNA synthetase
MAYDHITLEQKWQKFWAENNTFQTSNPPFAETKPKKYILDMFPYPSGAGLHVGHPKGYTATDIVSRYYHANGYNVLHPMGFDAFGLPAENYAVKTGTHPRITTEANIATFMSQMKALGFSYDWDRQVDTTDPEYYKWTQWIFLELFKRGLAYEAEMPVNWCPALKAVLANEEVVDGKSEIGGHPVEKKLLRQWVLRITEYADRLIDDLDPLDWPEGIKEMQRNWIGKSEGCEFRLMKEDGFRYSRATKEDFDEIIKIRKETDFHTVDFSQEQFFVAKKDSQIAAFLRVIQYGEIAELGALYVGESFRWNKLGYHLLSYVIDSMSAHTYYIDCIKELKDYYKNFGFSVAEAPQDFQMEKLRKVWKFYGKDFSDRDILDITLFMKLSKNDNFFTSPSIRVYTTRVDTVYGMTYAVLAPDHPSVQDFITDDYRTICDEYIRNTKAKTDLDRTNDGKEKTGVFTWSYVVNPYNGESVPLWIADYVLGSYGTWAVMAVPAHDERDGEFARKYNLPVKQSIANEYTLTGELAVRQWMDTLTRKVIDVILENEKGEFLLLEEQNPYSCHFIGWGIEEWDTEDETILKEIREESGYCDVEIVQKIPGTFFHTVWYRHSKQKNQEVLGQFIHVRLLSERRVNSEIEEWKHSMKWCTHNEVSENITWWHHALAWKIFQLAEFEWITSDGFLVNSSKYSGLTSSEARHLLTEKAESEGFGHKKVNYKLRDWLFSRQRYWGEPIPLIHISNEDYANLPRENGSGAYIESRWSEEFLMIDGVEFSKIYDWLTGKIVIDSSLPLLLPEVEKYEPSGDGQSPLATVPEWVNVKLADNLVGRRETNTMPQWWGSCWYYLRYMDAHNPDALASREAMDYWQNVDEYVGGAEHAVLHLLYARFWHKVLYDIWVVPTVEPFQKLTNVGMILAYAYERADGGLVAVDLVEEREGKYYETSTGLEVKQIVAKMSKSLKNVVNPTDVVWEYGADTLRLYEMSMGAFTDTAPWNTEAIIGVRRFLDKAYGAFTEGRNVAKDDMKAMKLLHKTVKKVGEDIVEYKFNTAISSLMILLNEWVPTDAEFALEWKEKFTILLHPFAPHMAEELWSMLWKTDSVYEAAWPEYDDFMLVDDEVTIAIQVNGKLRGTLTCMNGVMQEEVSTLAHENPDIFKWIEGKTLVKEIFIPNKMLSIVVKD